MRPIVLTALVAILAVGCSSTPSASSPPPATSATPSATRSASPASVSPSAIPSPDVSASPTTPAPPSATPIPSTPVVGQAPSGPWSSIAWVEAGRLPLGPTNVGVYGWSGGYVALEQTGGSDDEGNDTPVVIRAAASADGLTWSAPTTLETGFKGMFRIESIVEGPHGLLALGYPYGDTCGGPAQLFAMWTSPDGRAWERLPMPNGFLAGSVESIAGGRAGYIALGAREDGTTQAIWTSQEGRGWRSRPLPTVSSGTLALDSAVSFDGGFVLVGSVLGEEGCGGAQHIHYATWFSADGASWTRGSLPGASTDKNQSLVVHSSGDRVSVAQIPPGDAPTAPIWTSADGRTWTPAGTVSTDLVWGSVSDGRHTLLIIGPDSGIGLPTITGLRPDGRSTPITQSEEGPGASEDDPQYDFAIGPTGLLAVREDGEAAWLGVPS